MRLTPEQRDLVQSTFSALAADPDGATVAMLERLFVLDPGLRYLFPEDLNDQKRRLMSMIGLIVRRLDDWEYVEPRLRNLGLRHVSYGVKPSDYATFGQAMQDVLAERLGLVSESAALKAWAIVFESVAETMVEAGRAATSEAAVPG